MEKFRSFEDPATGIMPFMPHKVAYSCCFLPSRGFLVLDLQCCSEQRSESCMIHCAGFNLALVVCVVQVVRPKNILMWLLRGLAGLALVLLRLPFALVAYLCFVLAGTLCRYKPRLNARDHNLRIVCTHVLLVQPHSNRWPPTTLPAI